jgi:hypothetical protein
VSNRRHRSWEWSDHTRHSEAVARLEALSAAVAQVAETLERYEWQWLGRIETGLETVLGTWGLELGSVAFAPLEVFYSDLLDATLQAITAAASGKTEKALAILRPVLLGAVSHVTLEGLAQMLETTAEAGVIITALADERFAYRAPLWGGASTHVQPRYQYVILPPVAAADLAALTQAAAERHFAPSLAPAASVLAGCCIVTLAFYPVHTRAEVLTSVYAATRDAVTHNGSLPPVVVSA